MHERDVAVRSIGPPFIIPNSRAVAEARAGV